MRVLRNRSGKRPKKDDGVWIYLLSGEGGFTFSSSSLNMMKARVERRVRSMRVGGGGWETLCVPPQAHTRTVLLRPSECGYFSYQLLLFPTAADYIILRVMDCELMRAQSGSLGWNIPRGSNWGSCSYGTWLSYNGPPNPPPTLAHKFL